VRFKLDENLGRSVAELFHGAGHDITTVPKQRLQGALDERVFDVSPGGYRAPLGMQRCG
jgi:hypothetical protein